MSDKGVPPSGSGQSGQAPEPASGLGHSATVPNAFTPGPWHATNHFDDDTTPCNCSYVLSEGYAGSICKVAVDNGLAIADGGNDAPPRAEAAANAHLIVAAPELYEALWNLAGCLTHEQIERLGIEQEMLAVSCALRRARGEA